MKSWQMTHNDKMGAWSPCWGSEFEEHPVEQPQGDWLLATANPNGDPVWLLTHGWPVQSKVSSTFNMSPQDWQVHGTWPAGAWLELQTRSLFSRAHQAKALCWCNHITAIFRAALPGAGLSTPAPCWRMHYGLSDLVNHCFRLAHLTPHLSFFQDEIRLDLNLWDAHYLWEMLSTFKIRFCNSFKLSFIFFFNPELDFG